MLLIDSRIGSRELAAPLKKLKLPASLTHLDYGDVAWQGKGDDGASLSIGLEFKKLPELVQALRSNRFAGYQLPGMQETYDISYLLIEGIWRSGRSGELVSLQGKQWREVRGQMPAMELEERLITLELKGGLHVRFTNSRSDSLRAIGALYHWFTDRSWSDHASHIAIYQPTALAPISDYRRTVSTFPGVGIRTSLAVERQFNKSLRRTVLASEQEWADISTGEKRLGNKAAKRIIEYVR